MTAPAARDRAAVVTRTLVETIVCHIRDDGTALHARIEKILRDEFADVARTTLNEIRLEDG
jgi:hypothetical protein